MESTSSTLSLRMTMVFISLVSLAYCCGAQDPLKKIDSIRIVYDVKDIREKGAFNDPAKKPVIDLPNATVSKLVTGNMLQLFGTDFLWKESSFSVYMQNGELVENQEIESSVARIHKSMNRSQQKDKPDQLSGIINMSENDDRRFRLSLFPVVYTLFQDEPLLCVLGNYKKNATGSTQLIAGQMCEEYTCDTEMFTYQLFVTKNKPSRLHAWKQFVRRSQLNNSGIVLDYQVIDGQTVPSRWNHQYFQNGKLAFERQFTATSIAINQPVDKKDLDFLFPVGTRVHDRDTKEVHIADRYGAIQSKKSSFWIYALVSFFVAALVLVVLMILRRRRKQL